MSGCDSSGRSRRRWRLAGVYLGVFLVGSWLLPMAAASGTPYAPSRADVQGAAAGFTLSLAGDSPSSLGLQWTNAGDMLPTFSGYDLYSSTAGSTGPWTHRASIANESTTTYYVGGLSPGSAYWWQVSFSDTVLGTTNSNVLGVNQPAAATLTARQTAANAAHLSWTNAADYSGWVAFQSYRVEEAVANGSFGTLGTGFNASATTWDALALANDTSYRFRVTTTDACSGASNCGSASPSVVPSNEATLRTVADLSVAAGSNLTTIPQGGSVTLSCTGAGGATPYSVTWLFGDGNGGAGATTVHQYLRNGTFVAQCTLTDAFGSRAASGVSIHVTPSSVGNPTAAAGTNATTIPQGGSVTLSCTGAGGEPPYSVAWQFGDGNYGSGATTVHRYLQNGTFAAKCTLTDAFGSQAFSTVSIHVTPSSVGALAAAAGSNVTIIPQGGSVTLSCTGSGGATPYSVAWQFGDGTTGGGGTTVHRYLQNGTFLAKCTLTDSFGSRASSSVSIHVTPNSGSRSPGGSTPSNGGRSSLIGPVAAAVLVVAFVGAVAWLALLARRRRRGETPEPAPGSPGEAGGTSGEPAAPTATGPSTPGPGTDAPRGGVADIDRLMDELEDVSTGNE